MIPIYYIKNGNLHFADKVILSNIDIYLSHGDKICLIGRNGSGKSSLMKIIVGEYELDNGELFKNSSTTIGYLNQDVQTNLDVSIYDFILEQFENKNDNKYQADIILEKLNLNGNDRLKNCSGGQIRRASLARVLVIQPDILLLDEPTNHLDIATIEWLEDFVKSYAGAIVCISHDRSFLSNITNKIWWIDRGILRKSDKGFKYYDEWRELILEQEELALRKSNKKLVQENEWLNVGVTARRKRNQKRLADLINLRETLKTDTAKLNLSKQKIQPESLGTVKQNRFIIEATDVSFSYENKRIINNFTFRVKKGEKIGIIGPNGSGKTTFISLLTKQVKPDVGIITHGTKLEISHVDQHRTELNPIQTLQQTLCPSGGDMISLPDGTIHVAAYLKKFMFDPKLLSAKVSTLSGGEASRLLLAKTLIKPGNLLILDEPTNDLDMDSLEILIDILSGYTGTLLLVSHDRDFLNRLVTRTLIFKQNQIIDLIGGYEDYQKFIKNNSPSPKPSKLPAPIKSELIKPVNQSTPKKLSYKDKRLLETIPLEIESLEAKIKNIEEKLSDSNLYLSNTDKYNKLSDQLKNYKQQVDDLTNQWLAIDN
jgi:ATP-binding cassette subfamily F protein uup